ncbi:MAG: tryptophan synthase subunit alpha [Ignavibacteria bacterium]|nr:tryptophan synthase subunit alpha [Ignavibacteria bacterium]
MSKIKNYINLALSDKRKILSIFLTAGYPNPNSFVDLAKSIYDAGADFIELGIPSSDPLADGHVIQQSSQRVIEQGINITKVFDYAEELSKYTNKPIIAMGYANPLLSYGIKNFFNDAKNCGISGVIIPDVPIDEYDNFYENNNSGIDIILLTTPTSTDKRIIEIDNKSEGFVYYVSMTGTTGNHQNFDEKSLNTLLKTKSLITKNHILVGFGISNPGDVQKFIPHVAGVISGSAIIKSLGNGTAEEIDRTLKLVSDMKAECKEQL